MIVTKDPRSNALTSLINIEQKNRYSAIEIDTVLKAGIMSAQDNALYTRLVYGVLEKKLLLDYILSAFSQKELSRLDLETHMLLRLAAYQILFCDKIPDSAAVNESVNIASKACPRAKGFVNAVLRTLCRQRRNIEYPTLSMGEREYLSAYYSVSKDICGLLINDFGFEKTKSILNSFSRENYTTLRVNTLKTTREKMLSELDDRHIYAEKTTVSPHGIRIKSNLNELCQFANGECFVQDESSQICVLALDAQSGETVIDCCSCPGGKSFGTALKMQNDGILYSFDIHKNKLSLIEKEATKLGITIISTKECDARNPVRELLGRADRVICDVPCSGLGVLSKKPEMRYKDMTQASLLPDVQYSILTQSARYLKNGGTLVYSTCTLLKRENEEITDRFLNENPDFYPVDFKIGELESDNGKLCITPDMHFCDGFYICKMAKK